MHAQSINENAQRLLEAGESARAYELLQQAVRDEPTQVALWINLAASLRGLNRPDEEMAALDRALALEPCHAWALLQKAYLLERVGKSPQAAMTYRSALQVIPPGVELPAHLHPILGHAQSVVEANNRALESFLAERLKDARECHAGMSLRRFDRCMSVLLQKQRIYRQQPTFLYFPELPTIEFYERADFPWLDALEAASNDIGVEFAAAVADSAEFQPSVAFREGVPVNMWGELNHSRRWSSYYLWQEGVAFPKHIERCPRTVAALADWPRWDANGPTVFFSVLDAKTRIPPHTGVSSARLTIHLPLVIPPGCGLRVGAESRSWEPGKALVFDDTIEHEAWNDSDTPRTVLFLDTWNPLLSEGERDLVRRLVAGVKEYYAEA